MSDPETQPDIERRKLRTALIMASIAAAFFVGFVLKMWVLA